MQGNEESPGAEEAQACKVVTVAMDDRGSRSEIACEKHVRSDMAFSYPLKTH